MHARSGRAKAIAMRATLCLLAAVAVGSFAVACKDDPPQPTPDVPSAVKSGNVQTLKTGDSMTANPGNAPATPMGANDIPAPPDVAAPPSDADKTPSGLASKVLQKGSGATHPKKDDRVLVHYTGWTKEGKMFDSSVARNEPIAFGLIEVIPGWTEGVQLMVEGEKRRFWIPGNLAYGETPSRPGAPAGQLTFDVELLKILAPPETPKDVDAPPKDATKTASGLVYKVLTKGTGTDHPSATDTVVVNYSGWTKDGKMFDSSVVRGQPAKFPLNHVIKGWTEGVQLMVVGEKTRFWIPADLAYGDKPKREGAPSGQLTFDIELVEIKK